MPWGESQTEAMKTLITLLTSPPILALPNWEKRFRLHSDASQLGAGAVLTQFDSSMEKVLAYASHRWSVTDAKKSATDRECLGIIWAIKKFASYVQARPFTLITDCAALTWLFKSQALSAKYLRWALQLMELDMELEWRPGTRHQLPDALSRAPRLTPRGEDVDDSFPGDNSREKLHRSPQGPVLDGVPLTQLGVEVDEDDEEQPMVVLRHP